MPAGRHDHRDTGCDNIIPGGRMTRLASLVAG